MLAAWLQVCVCPWFVSCVERRFEFGAVHLKHVMIYRFLPQKDPWKGLTEAAVHGWFPRSAWCLSLALPAPCMKGWLTQWITFIVFACDTKLPVNRKASLFCFWILLFLQSVWVFSILWECCQNFNNLWATTRIKSGFKEALPLPSAVFGRSVNTHLRGASQYRIDL